MKTMRLIHTICAIATISALAFAGYEKYRGTACEICERTAQIEWAHELPRSLYKDRINDPSNGHTLCRDCHMFFHYQNTSKYWCADMDKIIELMIKSRRNMKITSTNSSDNVSSSHVDRVAPEKADTLAVLPHIYNKSNYEEVVMGWSNSHKQAIEKRHLTYIGSKYGKLTVLNVSGYIPIKNGNRSNKTTPVVLCQCECGKNKETQLRYLKIGHTLSCGCSTIDRISRFKENATTHGQSRTIEYRTWESMKDRCLNPNNKFFKHYGGRGIIICDRWKDSFASFLSDMGIRPNGKYSIDRINNNGNYEPTNCRWTTRDIQSKNTRQFKLTPEFISNAKELFSEGYSRKEIMFTLDVCKSTLKKALNA